MLRLGCENLHLVATLQFMAQRHELMINLGSDTMTSEEGVYGECKVECRTSCRHCLDLTFRSEDEYLRRKEVEFDGV